MWPYEVPGSGLDLNLNQILDQTLDMSRNKSMLQNLNARLSSYIHQVGRLESSNQALEHQIEAELRQRSPGDLKHLDSKQRIASDLQDQISVCIRDCAFLKLQSLGAELSMFDLKSRCEEVTVEREQLGAELSDLHMVWVEMQESHLTNLNQEVFQKEAELQRLQTQHEQDVQSLQSRRAGLSVQLRSRNSNPDLSLQLQDRSWSGLTLPPLDWSLQAPQMEACAPPEESELLHLKNTASGLQRELDLLRQEARSLESAAVDHMGALEEHLSVSQLKASSLCDELQTTLNATDQQTQRNQNLQGRVTALRAELHRYHELLREANQDEDLLMRTNQSGELLRGAIQGGQLIMRTNLSRDQLPTAHQRTEHRVLSPGPIKSPSSPLKWPTSVTQMPSPKGQRSVQAGQSVQRKIGFEPDPRVAPAILSDSKHNTTVKTAAKNSPDEIQNVNINVNTSERVSFGLKKEDTKPNMSSAKSATEIKVTDAKTHQNLNLNLKTAQIESGVKLAKDINVTSVHKMESKMERSDGGLAPMKSKEDANVQAKVSSTKTETEKINQHRLQNANINVNASEGVSFGLEKEVKGEKKEETKPNMSSAKSATEMKVTESKTLQDLNLNLKTAQVETGAKVDKDVNVTSVHKMESKMERSDGGLAPMKSKEDANVQANVSSTKTKTAEICGKVEIKSEVCAQNGGSVSQNSLQNANINVNASEGVHFGLEKEVKAEKKEEATPNMSSAKSATEMKVTESKTLQDLNLNLKTAQVETGASITSVHKMESKMKGSDGGLAPMKSKDDGNTQAVSSTKTETAEIRGKVEIKSEVCTQNGGSVKLKDKMEDVKTGMILNAQILKGQNLKMEEKIPHENQEGISMTTEIQNSTNVSNFGVKNLEISKLEAVETQTSQSEQSTSTKDQSLTHELKIQTKMTQEEESKDTVTETKRPQLCSNLSSPKCISNSEVNTEILQKTAVEGWKEESSQSLINVENQIPKKEELEIENEPKMSPEHVGTLHTESNIIVVKITEEIQQSLTKTKETSPELTKDMTVLDLETRDGKATEYTRKVLCSSGDFGAKDKGNSVGEFNLSGEELQNFQAVNLPECSPKSAESGKRRSESNIVIVKIIEEAQDSLSKTNAYKEDGFVLEDNVFNSESWDQNAPNQDTALQILGDLKDSSSQNLTTKRDEESGGDMAKVQNLEVGIVSENSGMVGTEMKIEHSKTAEIANDLTKMNAEKQEAVRKKQEEVNADITSKLCNKNATENQDRTVEILGNLKNSSAQNLTAKQDKESGGDTAKVQNLEVGTVSENSTKQIIGNFGMVGTKDTQKIQVSERQEMEISKNLVPPEQEKALPKSETEKPNILAKFTNDETKISTSLADYEMLCSDFPTSNLEFEQNLEFPQNPEIEEEFLKLNEDAFCPQDLEHFVETQMDPSVDADFDEDLTEANVRVRPVERFVLKESPSFSDSFSDLEENAAIQESLTSFGEDRTGVSICANVPGSLQIYGPERVIAEKERESGFGGLYRIKAKGTCKERENLVFNDGGKVDMEQAKGTWVDDLSTKTVRGCIQGSLGRDLVKTQSEEERGGGGIMVQNESKLEGIADGNDVESGVCGASSERHLSMEKECEKDRSLKDVRRKDEGMRAEEEEGGENVTKREGSLDIPLSPPASAKVGSEWRVYGRSTGRMSTSPPQNQNLSPTKIQGLSPIKTQIPKSLGSDLSPTKSQSSLVSSPRDSGRIDALYGGNMASRERDLVPRALSPGRFGKADSGEWFVYGNRERISRRASESDEQFGSPGHLSPNPLTPTSPRPISPSDPGRFGRASSGEWRVYGQNQDRLSSSADRERALSPLGYPRSPTSRTMSPLGRPISPLRCPMSPSGRAISPTSRTLSPLGRFGAGSAEFYVYGNRDRISHANREGSQLASRALSPGRPMSPEIFGRFSPDGFSPDGFSPDGFSPDGSHMSPLSPYSRFSPRALSPGGSGLRDRSLSPDSGRGEWLVYRSLSPRRGDVDGGHFDLRARHLSPPSTGRLGKPDGKDWHVYKIPSATDEKQRKRALSPPEVQRKLFFIRSSNKSKGDVVRRSGSLEGGAKTPRISGTRGRNLVSSIGKFVSSEWRLGRSKNKGGKDVGNNELGGTGGRVITSSDGPIRSSGSGTGAKKERISVCKMAAMAMSKDKVKKDTAASPSIQLWLSTSDAGVRPEDSKP